MQLAHKEQARLTTAETGQAWAVAPEVIGKNSYGTTLTPAEVAAAAIAGVRNDRLYVFTHPESRTRIEARLRPLLDDLDAGEKERN